MSASLEVRSRISDGSLTKVCRARSREMNSCASWISEEDADVGGKVDNVISTHDSTTFLVLRALIESALDAFVADTWVESSDRILDRADFTC